MPTGPSELRLPHKGAWKSSVTSRLCVLQSNNISGGRQLVWSDRVSACSRVLHKTSRRHVETGDDDARDAVRPSVRCSGSIVQRQQPTKLAVIAVAASSHRPPTAFISAQSVVTVGRPRLKALAFVSLLPGSHVTSRLHARHVCLSSVDDSDCTVVQRPVCLSSIVTATAVVYVLVRDRYMQQFFQANLNVQEYRLDRTVVSVFIDRFKTSL